MVDRISSGLDRIAIRWRLAVTSALLTFVILCGFALVIGQLTTSRIRSDFENKQAAAVESLRNRLQLLIVDGAVAEIRPSLDFYAASNNAVIRVLDDDGTVIGQTRGAPDFGSDLAPTEDVGGYRVLTRTTTLRPTSSGGVPFSVSARIQYAQRLSDVETTVGRVRLFLLLGVLAGTGIALGAGLVLARRAMRPIAGMTATAREITRTGDPDRHIDVPPSQDEVAELARTLDDMLQGLARSREETEALLARQRQFVADASHELRTPLTSVYANLELLCDVLDGEPAEAARSALRSTQRMRRLVADLLLLARADAGRRAPMAPTDLAQVVVDAAAELSAIAGSHRFAVEASGPVMVSGSRDDLHRLALNLMENALRHTPPETAVEVRVAVVDGRAELDVEDDGPGVPPEIQQQLFERFVRGAGDRGGSFGLGLSIVKAVAESHDGSVELQPPLDGVGARFVVRIPLLGASDLDDDRQDHGTALQPLPHELA